jgi:chromosome segregation ATPase
MKKLTQEEFEDKMRALQKEADDYEWKMNDVKREMDRLEKAYPEYFFYL